MQLSVSWIERVIKLFLLFVLINLGVTSKLIDGTRLCGTVWYVLSSWVVAVL